MFENLAHGVPLWFAPDHRDLPGNQALSSKSHVPYAGRVDLPLAGFDAMTKTIFLVLLLAAAPLSADTKNEITTALDYFSEIWNEGDLEAIRGYYHPDFVLITQNGVASLQQRLAEIDSVTKEGQDRGVLNYSDVTVKELEEKHAVAYGHSSLKFKDGSGFETWFTTVYVKTPFGWKALLTRH
jgi:hypothetical protein